MALVDMRMPGMDGIEVTRVLAGPGAPVPVKVVVVTTFDLPSGSRAVTLEGSFRHIVYLGAVSAGIDDAVNRYLIDGMLPDRDLTRTADG